MGRRSSDSLKKKRAKKPNKQKLVSNNKKNLQKKQAHKQGKIHKQKPANKIHAGCGITVRGAQENKYHPPKKKESCSSSQPTNSFCQSHWTVNFIPSGYVMRHVIF